MLGGTSMGEFICIFVWAIRLTSCFVCRLFRGGFIRKGTNRVVDPHHRAASCGAHVVHVEPTDGPHDPGRELLQRVSHEQSAGTAVQGCQDRGLLAAVFLHDARPGELRAHRAQERDAVEVRPCVHGARGVPPAAVRLGAEGGGGRGGNRPIIPADFLGWKNFRKRRPDLYERQIRVTGRYEAHEGQAAVARGPAGTRQAARARRRRVRQQLPDGRHASHGRAGHRSSRRQVRFFLFPYLYFRRYGQFD